MSTYFIKASSYKMVEENSKRAPSYWYSIEHAGGKKSFYHLLMMNRDIPYMEDPGKSQLNLEGKNSVLFHFHP